MNTLFRAIVLACACLGFSSSGFTQLNAAPTEQDLIAKGAKELVGDELKLMLTNQTLLHTNLASGQAFPMYFREDGTRFVKIGTNVRTTKWWIKDGRRCEDSIGRPRVVCQKHFVDEGLLRVCAEGEAACNWVLSVAPGDVEGLAK